MARGTIVLDENVLQLKDALASRNIHVVVPPSGMKDDDITRDLLVGRILVTRNSKDFVDSASSYDVGIIALDELSFIDSESKPGKNKTFNLISKAVIEFDIWSKRHGFILYLQDNGKHRYQDLTD